MILVVDCLRNPTIVREGSLTDSLRHHLWGCIRMTPGSSGTTDGYANQQQIVLATGSSEPSEEDSVFGMFTRGFQPGTDSEKHNNSRNQGSHKTHLTQAVRNDHPIYWILAQVSFHIFHRGKHPPNLGEPVGADLASTWQLYYGNPAPPPGSGLEAAGR